ncbi:MAG: response regulator [Candidatus Competibacterales bacterium]
MTTVLVIEDNELNRDVLGRRLRKRGYEVLEAEDAEVGLALAKDRRPGVILMDLELPGVDGYQATATLKKDPTTAAIPVIALTAHAIGEYRERALAAGCDDFHAKPFELPRLLAQIEALVGAAP